MNRNTATVELIDWQIFTDMWMDTMWALHKQSNHHRLSVVMRTIDQKSGIGQQGIQHYIDLAIQCQANYFAKFDKRKSSKAVLA